MERKLQMLEAHQKGVHDTLAAMEPEAERLFREDRSVMDDDTK